jgi:hypothetical protein
MIHVARYSEARQPPAVATSALAEKGCSITGTPAPLIEVVLPSAFVSWEFKTGLSQAEKLDGLDDPVKEYGSAQVNVCAEYGR